MLGGQEWKNIVRLAWPVVLGQLSQVALSVIDSIMIGPLGADHLAAVALSSGLFFVPMVCAMSLMFAISPLTSMARSAGDEQSLEKTLKNGMIIAGVVGLFLVGTMYPLTYLLHFLGQPDRVVALAQPYLQIVVFSMLPIMLFQGMRQFSEGLEIMFPPLIVGLIMIPLNIFGNWLLIYGNWGFPKMGLEGAAWATTISRLVSALIMFTIVAYGSRLRSFRILQWRLSDFCYQTLKRILRLGLPGSLQYLAETSAFSLAALMIGHLGSVSLAAHQIAINLASISFMVSIGISSAGAIRIGQARGRGDRQAARRTGFSALALSAAFMAFCGIIFWTLRFELPTLYINDPEVIQVAARLLIIAAAFQLADGIQAVGVGLLRGMEDVKMPTLYVLLAYWLIALPLAWILSNVLSYGVEGIWSALGLGLACSALMLTFRFHRITLNQV
ncbi:MAG: MATE family efflux transporter [Bacteroidia bacterium]